MRLVSSNVSCLAAIPLHHSVSAPVEPKKYRQLKYEMKISLQVYCGHSAGRKQYCEASKIFATQFTTLKNWHKYFVLSCRAAALGTPMGLGDRVVKCHPIVPTVWPLKRAWTHCRNSPTKHHMVSELPRVPMRSILLYHEGSCI